MNNHEKKWETERERPLSSIGLNHGMSQVSLVETALSPLDYVPDTPVRHVSEFLYSDNERRRRKGQVTVNAVGGLSPTDELTLYGLLAITFADRKPVLELTATPHFLSRQLGLPIGGDHYKRLRESIHRLSLVHYHNTAWWDRQRSVHRDVGFHFLSHDLPAENNQLDRGREPWTIVWNPLFFRLVLHSQGFIWFDFTTYRELKQPAARRGFLLLQKIFHHSPTSPRYDLRSFAVNQLGYSPSLELKSIRQKVKKIIEIWQELEVVSNDIDLEHFFRKEGPGEWTLCLPRGNRFENRTSNPIKKAIDPKDHPAWEILQQIGLTPQEIQAVFLSHSEQMIYVSRAAILARSGHHLKGQAENDAKARFYRILESSQESIEELTPSWPIHQLYESRKNQALTETCSENLNHSKNRNTPQKQKFFHFPPFQEWIQGETE
jgi:hypothetical protein